VIRTVDQATFVPDDVGFLLAKASQRFNELLMARFSARGFGDVRPSFGSILVPLFDEDGLRLGELAGRARLSKQSVTGLVKLCEQADLVSRERDPDDGRAYTLRLTARGRNLRDVAQRELRSLDDELIVSLGKTNHAALRRALKGVMDL
jgi:DNA-binding MarR family transcriptional regulator